ncbi:division plane positioning ATPase MipZ [Ancylobacter sp. VNQ12]|uniref:nucleotide-binding protein n=1 Tax=Ancylobacter sp. VNQ12 TaxID=3400920 RepID=UPI003BFBF182
MPYIIGVVSQKGGVGKSTVCRLVASEFARMDGGTWDVKIADLDVSQATSFHWMQRRHRHGVTPEIRVEGYQRLEKAIEDAGDFHVMVLDGAPHATSQTLKIGLAADVVVIPTGTALDDLEPAVALARELAAHQVETARIVFVLSRTGDSDAEVAEARGYLAKTGFRVAEGCLPERTAYRRASDLGQAASETAYPSLNGRAKAVFESIVATLTNANTKKRTAA